MQTYGNTPPQANGFGFQQFAQQAPVFQAAPTSPPATGDVEGFFDQPSTGEGPVWSFGQVPEGTTYVGVVARAIRDSDIQQQTDFQTKQPLFYQDGRPRWVMKVPLQVPVDEAHPEGLARWYVQPNLRDELIAAMTRAGAPMGPPEEGATLKVTLVARRPIQGVGRGYKNVWAIEYTRPAAPPSDDPNERDLPGLAEFAPKPKPEAALVTPAQPQLTQAQIDLLKSLGV